MTVGNGAVADRLNGVRWAAAALLLAGALAYLLTKSVFSHDPESDFRFLWTAGRIWASGADPYSEAFTGTGKALFPDGNEIAYWLYPPQWWPICRALAVLPVAGALLVWRVVNAVLLMAGGLILVRACRRAGLALPAWGALLFLALLPLSEATPQTLAMGQTSILVATGLCLTTAALLTGGEAAMAAGLFLLCLKPQFGVAVVVPLLLDRRWWRAIGLAVLFSALAALPQLLAHGVGGTLDGFLHNLARHGTLAPNQPGKLSGITQIAVRAAGLHLPTGVAILLAAAFAILVTISWRRKTAIPATRAAGIGLALVSASMFFLPLHTYDFTGLLPAAVLAVPFGRPVRAPVWGGILLAAKAGPVAALVGAGASGAIVLLTLAALLVLLGALLALGRVSALSPRDAMADRPAGIEWVVNPTRKGAGQN